MVDAFGVFCKNMSTYNHYFSLHFIELFQTELGVALQGPLQQSYEGAFYFYFIHYSIFPLQVEKGHFRAGIHTGGAQIHQRRMRLHNFLKGHVMEPHTNLYAHALMF